MSDEGGTQFAFVFVVFCRPVAACACVLLLLALPPLHLFRKICSKVSRFEQVRIAQWGRMQEKQ
jgi:hypothetical protein